MTAARNPRTGPFPLLVSATQIFSLLLLSCRPDGESLPSRFLALTISGLSWRNKNELCCFVARTGRSNRCAGLLRVGLLIHVLTEALFLNFGEVELTFARCWPWLCDLTILHFPSVLFSGLCLLELLVSRPVRSYLCAAVIRPC